jgi:LTXXQ motif family protein
MKNSKVVIGTILLMSVAAIVMPLTAEAAHGFGGGHGGGGGAHFGGGGGGFRMGGGGMHLGGGGGGFRMGGGGMRLGGGRIGGLRIGGSHPGGLSRQALHPGNRTLQSGHSLANLHSLTRTHGLPTTRVAPNFSRQAFAHNAFFRGHNFRRFVVFGFVGPLFWPYAYSDIYCDIFWGYWGYGCADPYWSYAYGDPFWDYGYAGIYGGLFSPFASNDLTAYLPTGRSGKRLARSKVTPSEALAEMCGDDTKEVAGWPIDRIRQLVSADEQQGKALDDLADASVKAAQIIKTACPTSAAVTPTGRLAAMQQRIESMEQAVDAVRRPLETFYGSLTDEQKAKFNSANQTPAPRNGRQRGLAQSCAASNTSTQWPEARIETAVQPNDSQQAKLKALESAATKAAEQLAASCPSELPTTPPARLAAVTKRLEVMLGGVKNVRAALDDLYGDLSDEQKAQFNKIGQAPSRTAQRQG